MHITNVAAIIPRVIKIFFKIELCFLIIMRFVANIIPEMPPPIAPPITGTIEQSATELPQIIIKIKISEDSTISYQAGFLSTSIVSPLTTTLTPDITFPLTVQIGAKSD